MARAYAEQGYLILDLALPEALLADAGAVTRGFLGRHSRVQDGYRRFPAIRELAVHPPVLELLAELYGRRPVPFQTLNFPVGTQQGSHADTIFFDSRPAGMMCGLWIALEDIDAGAGPLHYYPGSHRRDVVTPDMIDATHGGDLYARFRDETADFPKRTALLERGQAILWSANLLHGGEAISRPGATRLSQVTHYYFEGCAYTAPIDRDADGESLVRFPYDISRGRFVLGRDPDTGRRVWPRWRYALSEWRSRLSRRITTEPAGE